MAYFSGPLGPKRREGDTYAPEGVYDVPPSCMNPKSTWHLSCSVGDPNLDDQAHQRTGSAMMGHGNTVSLGCFAMTDPLIEDISTIAEHALNAGQRFFRVHVFPFRMTEDKMTRHAQSSHLTLWKNLQEGSLLFERTHRPPKVIVEQNQSVFEADGDTV